MLDIRDASDDKAPQISYDRVPEDADHPEFRYRLTKDEFERALKVLFDQMGGFDPKDPRKVNYRRWVRSRVLCSERDENDVLIPKDLADEFSRCW